MGPPKMLDSAFDAHRNSEHVISGTIKKPWSTEIGGSWFLIFGSIKPSRLRVASLEFEWVMGASPHRIVGNDLSPQNQKRFNTNLEKLDSLHFISIYIQQEFSRL